MIHTILFDLDDTLYPRNTGIMDQIRTLMLRYICKHLGLSPEQADELRRTYFLAYGTTMRGLQINHQIDANDFLDFVHNMHMDQYIQPNPRLNEILSNIPQAKVIFTNASREHAERVLDVLGIRHQFERIVDVRDVNYESKPQPAAYRRICEILDVEPSACLLVEDNVKNLRPAKALGMITVLVDAAPDDGVVDFAIDRIEEIGWVIEHLAAA